MRRIALGVAAFAAALAVTACGSTPALVATAEAEALAAMGVNQADLVTASTTSTMEPTPGDKNGKRRWDGRRPQKVLLRKNVLHGEAVVQTKEGPVNVAVQRGVVTAIDDSSVTVKSSDGFTWTWTFHAELKVIEKRTSIQPGEIKAGAGIALAGPKSGDQPQARLIVLSPAG